MTKVKLLTMAAAFCLVSGAAQAQLNVGISIGQPAYIAPAPVVVGPPAYYSAPVISTWDPHHRRHDWEYWRGQRGHDEHWHR